MALSAGIRLGPYEILAPLGAGGMGEVYRAKDHKLGRQVAVKVLPDELASDRARRQRFEREARAASALNHPNTVTIHDIDEQDGVHYIAMELVEGQTLRDRLGDGPLPIEQTLHISTQMAQGLAKAHAAGIVHRDLKPGNVMITDDGLVKILDFGLAKQTALTDDAPSALTTAAEVTREGVVLGTVPYMSPEQAAGRPVDFRSDQFSFGSILYEMATGRRAFECTTPPQSLAAIIEAEPTPVVALNDRVPAALVAIIERCLARGPDGRYDSTEDLAKELADCTSAASTPTRSSRIWMATAGSVVLAAAVAGFLYWGGSGRAPVEPPATPLVSVPLTSYPGREAEPTFSPDGSQVAFSWDGPNRTNRDIYVKVIGSEPPLRLTSDPAQDGSPAWSPDGRQIAFLRALAGGSSEVRLVPPTGGPERLLASVGGAFNHGLSWSPDGRQLATADRSSSDELLGIFVLDVESGEKRRLTSASSGSKPGDYMPAFSPNGETVVFLRGGGVALHLVPAGGGEARRLVSGRVRAAWTPDGDEVLFSAIPRMTEGEAPTPSSGYGGEHLLWRIPLGGRPARQVPGPANAYDVAISRVGNRLAYAQERTDWEIWKIGLHPPAPEHGTQRRFLSSTRIDGNPQFSPDDARVAFTSGRSGHNEIWVADEDGGNLLQVTSLGGAGEVGSPRWSPDGQRIAFDFRREGEGNNYDVYVVSASGGPPRQITTAESRDVTPTWSANGEWIYFSSNRSGQHQVWKVPSSGEEEWNARQVTRGGGYAPTESDDGEHLYFSWRFSGDGDPENAIWRMPVEGGDEEVVIDSLRSSWNNWDLTSEGIYFVDQSPASPGAPWVLKFFGFKEQRATEIARLRHPPSLSGPGFSISSDGRWALSMQRQEESDLMLVEKFP